MKNAIPDSTLAEWASLLASIKPSGGFVITRHDEPIDDDVFPTEEAARDAVESRKGSGFDFAPVSVQVTIGFTPDGPDNDPSWSYQTGDNSYSGGAYGHPIWGLAYLTSDSDPVSVARDIADEIESQIES